MKGRRLQILARSRKENKVKITLSEVNGQDVSVCLGQLSLAVTLDYLSLQTATSGELLQVLSLQSHKQNAMTSISSTVLSVL